MQYFYNAIHKWNEEAFIASGGNWDSFSSKRNFMNSVAKKLNITDPESWYKLKTKNLKDQGGSTLLHKYTMSELFSTVYPEYLHIDKCLQILDISGTQPSLIMFLVDIGTIFKTNELSWTILPNKIVSNLNRNFLVKFTTKRSESCGTTGSFASFCRELNKDISLSHYDIQSPHDWYSISIQQFHRSGAGYLLAKKYNNSLIQLLRAFYPDHPWGVYRYSTPHHVPSGKTLYSKTQHLLLRYVQNVGMRYSMLTYRSFPTRRYCSTIR